MLNDLLEKFTKKYVQCFECENPETRIRIKKGNIYLKCKVGLHRSLSDYIR